MRGRKRMPLARVQTDADQAAARAKVSLILDVLSGVKAISEACREQGLKPLQYYKLEERMIRAMLQAASMPQRESTRLSREATRLTGEMDALRREHRRMKSLVRVSRKLFRENLSRKRGPARPRNPEKKTIAGPTQASSPPSAAEPPRRSARAATAPAACAAEK